MKFKYIMYDVDGFKIPVIFGDAISHADMGHRIRPTNWSHFKFAIAASAGFINFRINEDGEQKASCYGESISMKLESAAGDSEIVQRYLDGY